MDTLLWPLKVAVAWVMVTIHKGLVLIGFPDGPGVAWVLSIIGLTIVVRLLIMPLFVKQIRASRGMQLLQPEMQALQAKYKGKKDMVSRQKMTEETQALYRKHKVSPFASCLPLLVQMPVLFAMYRAIYAVKDLAEGTYTYSGQAASSLGPITQTTASEINGSTVFGVPLSHTLRTETSNSSAAIVFVVAIILMVALQFVSMRLSFSRNMPDMGSNPMARSQRSMMYVMPVMFVFSGVFFQMGVVVYTVTSSFWALGQAYWTIKVMPTPGSPAYADLRAKREKDYQEWAKPYFVEYDRRRAELPTSATDPDVVAFNEKSLAEIRQRAKKQKIASDFPDFMSAGDIVTVYRNLASQEWTTLPDEQWMHGLRQALEKARSRKEAVARPTGKKKSREQRLREAAAQREASAPDKGSSAKTAQGAAISAAELERRRQERRRARRKKSKNKR